MDVLTQEIEKIRAESMMQVNTMRDHYAAELQALREELVLRESELKGVKLPQQDHQRSHSFAASAANEQVKQ